MCDLGGFTEFRFAKRLEFHEDFDFFILKKRFFIEIHTEYLI